MRLSTQQFLIAGLLSDNKKTAGLTRRFCCCLLFILKCLLFFEGFEVAAAFRLGFLEVEVEIVAAFLS